MRTRSGLVAGLVLLSMAVAGCGGGSSDGDAAKATTTEAPTTTEAEATTSSTEAVPVPTDARGQLALRLGTELDAPQLGEQVVAELDDGLVDQLQTMAGGDIMGSPKLSYDPDTIPADDVDSLWVFSYGFRFADEGQDPDGLQVGETPPPMDELVPGPTNEALAQAAADFVEDHPVPIVAQWEVAQVLEEMGVPDVISVEPDVAADGTVTYLSTKGVADKGLTLAEEAGVPVGQAGVLCFADHAVRCLLTAEAAGMTAGVPAGVELPDEYDPESGQAWTRSREAWIPVDLLGRSIS